ncbi:Hypothetical_protein [Hexamita inflata]|uniref:Hypothetical_protein n=1 Tax=Hexamita inflata TaxID=28002 RepID=A0AA86UM31_9EUKA|nr:Hypothetical protein HINF_LOCUS48434 [Hexamita inflata]
MPCFSEKRETTKMQRSVKNSNQFQLLFQGSSQILVNIKMRILIQWQKERLERSSLSLYRHFRCGVERLPAELQFQYSPEYKSLPGEKVPTGLKNRVARQLYQCCICKGSFEHEESLKFLLNSPFFYPSCFGMCHKQCFQQHDCRK